MTGVQTCALSDLFPSHDSHDDEGNNVIRAIVSERYGVIDNHEAMQMVVNALRMFTDIPSSMINFLKEREYNDDMVKYVNAELDRRETEWNNKGKEKRSFNVRVRHDDEGNNVIRAIVSERYGVIDNHEAMQMVVNALPSLNDALASHLFNDGDDIFGNILLS